MNFADEPYVRVYKRRTTTMAVIGWQARAVLRELFLLVDKAGVLDLDDEDAADAVTALISDMPVEVVRDALSRLSDKGCIRIGGGKLVLPRFREAQETAQSDRLRAKETRDRRRADALDDVSRNVTAPSQNVTQESQSVTDRHETTTGVTPRHAASLTNTNTNTNTNNAVQSTNTKPESASDTPPVSAPHEKPDDPTRRAMEPQRHEVSELFEAWQSESGKSGATLDRARSQLFARLVADGVTVEQVREATRGAKLDRWAREDTKLSPSAILGTAEQRERFIGLARDPPRPKGAKEPRKVQPNVACGPRPKEWTG